MKKQIANWGNYPVIETNEESFVFLDQLEELMHREKTFIPRGNGRSYGDASLADTTISTLKFDKILSFDTTAGIFECESGLMLDAILNQIVPAGWFLPVTPGTKFITVGGAVACDIHGKNHHLEGSFSKHLLELELLLASGESIICSPDLNSDLFEATCGGMGLTGIIIRAKFRLKRIETAYVRRKKIRAGNLEELLQLFEKYSHYTYSVAWIDCLKKGPHFGRSILSLGEHASIDDLSLTQKNDPLRLPVNNPINFPFNLPSRVLNSYTVKAFNFFYYFKNLKKEADKIVGYESFFYPLDTVLHWNRGYGKKGFIQYQFVLPPEAKEGLVEILRQINVRNMGSFQTVLKIFGPQQGLISFPKAGYTLALDFPVRGNLLVFLDELDEIVVRFGGRLYLSKDARMKPEILELGYPKLDRFKEIVRKYNPEGKIRSLQSDRLLLTPN